MTVVMVNGLYLLSQVEIALIGTTSLPKLLSIQPIMSGLHKKIRLIPGSVWSDLIPQDLSCQIPL